MQLNDYLDEQYDYPLARSVLAEEYADLPDEELEQLYFDVTDGGDIEDYEDFLKSLSRFGQKAGKALGQAAPGIIQGALSGATTGAALGPYGALAGGILGAVGGGVMSHQAANRRPVPTAQRPQVAAPTHVTTPSVPQRPVAGAGVTPTPSLQQQVHAINPGIAPTVRVPPQNAALATTLAAFLQRPETLQAIAALMAGQLGRRTVPVENVEVPTENFLLTIETLARYARAADHFGESDVDDVSASYDDDVATDLIERLEQSSENDSWFDTPAVDEDWSFIDDYEEFDDNYVPIDEYDPDVFVSDRLELG